MVRLRSRSAEREQAFHAETLREIWRSDDKVEFSTSRKCSATSASRASASRCPSEAPSTPSQTPLMCWFESSSAADSAFLAVLCEDHKLPCFQGALSLCQMLFGLGSATTEIRYERSWDTPRSSLHDAVRHTLEDAEGKLSELAPSLNFSMASVKGIRALGLGWNKLQLQRAACFALALTIARRKHSPSVHEGGDLYPFRKVADKAPHFKLQAVNVAIESDDPEFVNVKEEPEDDSSNDDTNRCEADVQQPSSLPSEATLRFAAGSAMRQKRKRSRSMGLLNRVINPRWSTNGDSLLPTSDSESDSLCKADAQQPASLLSAATLRFAAKSAMRQRRKRSRSIKRMRRGRSESSRVSLHAEHYRSRDERVDARLRRAINRPRSQSRCRSHTRSRRAHRKQSQLYRSVSMRRSEDSSRRVAKLVPNALRSSHRDENGDDEPMLSKICIRGETLDESSTLEDVLSIVRADLCSAVVKKEAEAPLQEVNAVKLRLLKEMATGAWRFDPSRFKFAWETQRHLVRSIDVTALRHTHDVVHDRFMHGEHQGISVRELTADLLSNRATVDQITAMVVVILNHVHWVVCGNRRLKALKDFEVLSKHAGARPIQARCIAYDVDAGPVPTPVLAKFLLSATTRNSGRSASFRERKHLFKEVPAEATA